VQSSYANDYSTSCDVKNKESDKSIYKYFLYLFFIHNLILKRKKGE